MSDDCGHGTDDEHRGIENESPRVAQTGSSVGLLLRVGVGNPNRKRGSDSANSAQVLPVVGVSRHGHPFVRKRTERSS